MIQKNTRTIHKRANTGHVADLLQSIFLAELLNPSEELWIMSPWISDIPIIDNRGNQFTHLHPAWEGSRVKLSAVVFQLLLKGAAVYLVTRPEEHNVTFLGNLNNLLGNKGYPLHIREVQEFHEKGILGGDYYLSGSMNLTYYGITLNEEVLHYFTDSEIIAEKKLFVRDRWGVE